MRDFKSSKVSPLAVSAEVRVFLRGIYTRSPRCLGIENKKGTLRAGADADFVVMDKAGNVLNTWVGGKMVWEKPRRT